MKLIEKIKARIRLFTIYLELGYVPWRKPARERRKRKERKQKNGVYMGARENIPFLNEDGKRTIAQLIFRPGYLMRDYILRGEHERYLAPLTAMILFYTVFSLALAVIKPGALTDTLGDGLYRGLHAAMIQKSDTTRIHATEAETQILLEGEDAEDYGEGKAVENNPRIRGMLQIFAEALVITRLDLHPEAADTPWKKSLAALEGDLRSKGVPLFLDNFLFLWLAMAILLRKYRISFSGAAAASAYFLCQYCLFMFLALLFTWGDKSQLGLLLTALLLFIDYRQLLGIGIRRTIWLTIKTGVLMVTFKVLFYLLLGGGLVLFALAKTGAPGVA